MVVKTKNKNTLLLLAIFGFAFLFRVAVLLHNQYPPSSDIGLHGGIINLILDQGTLPIRNPYHMGGQLLPTPPGFHFFVSILILFSGIPLLYAQVITAAFFSSFIVFPAYLVSKKIWRNTTAGILAGFFAGISTLSFEMISWGGYTNIVSLALIVTIMYLFLRDISNHRIFNFLIAGVLFGSLIITHTFSLFVLLPILVLYFIFLLLRKAWKFKDIEFQKKLSFFIFSGLFGILLVSPWLIRVFGFYLGASSEGSFLGGVPDNRNLILANRTVDSLILGLFIALIPAFFLFKTYRKKYSDNTSLFLIAWFVVPLVMTHAYVFGISVDYSRFMYFIDFPGIVIISAGLLYLFSYLSSWNTKFFKNKGKKFKKIIPLSLFTAIFIVFIILSPWAILPHDAPQRAEFYSAIKQPEYTTIEWIQNKTPETAVLVGDHLYGWWLSGIGKRATLSAAGLEFLLYAQEMEVARDAQLLLDTDYYFENGVIQIREDGPYLSRHNPIFSVEKLSGEATPVFYFKDNETLFEYEIIDYKPIIVGISETKNVHFLEKVVETGNLTLSEMEMVETSITQNKQLNLRVMTTTRESPFFVVKKILLVYQGIRSVDISYEITAKNNTNLSTINFRIYVPTIANLTQINTISPSIIRYYNPYTKVAGYITFKNPSNYTLKNISNYAELQCIMSNKNYKKININFQVEIFDDTDWIREDLNIFQYCVSSLKEKRINDLVYVWNYTEMIEKYNVTHIVCRDPRVYPKFSEDPLIQFVFNSGKVAIFQVKE